MSFFSIFLKKKESVPVQGPKGISILGHRGYVGGLWEEIGRLQFDFVLNQGLKPQDVLLDIGCGALRGGVHFIRYLDKGCYLGIDREKLLIRAGKKELGKELFKLKKPELVVSSCFEFHKFSKKPGWALAQSLFTHLTRKDIEDCLKKLRTVIIPPCLFFATFFIENEPMKNPEVSDSLGYFGYTLEEVQQMANNQGWHLEYIGEWNHPRNQKMVKFYL
ncbi:hypothetical protein IT6_07010 [Methylacidiphilum caldifontis]|uniref:class I SAM-dependent methyltransferase n=2 Tax=Methylacidiphilum caldifontis TaxID=2795386 RepID=UPI001A90BE10|nr:class I SAM-dependent methyltransferase [Methylacidiphilum caldifontis]QSR88133.1 hypothetical protein IT6_07010 [Methylacidiphilum caldifontis]